MFGPNTIGFAQRRRFDGILAALRRQAFADKNHRGVLVKISQFAGRVDQQAFHFAGGTSGCAR